MKELYLKYLKFNLIIIKHFYNATIYFPILKVYSYKTLKLYYINFSKMDIKVVPYYQLYNSNYWINKMNL